MCVCPHQSTQYPALHSPSYTTTITHTPTLEHKHDVAVECKKLGSTGLCPDPACLRELGVTHLSTVYLRTALRRFYGKGGGFLSPLLLLLSWAFVSRYFMWQAEALPASHGKER